MIDIWMFTHVFMSAVSFLVMILINQVYLREKEKLEEHQAVRNIEIEINIAELSFH